MNEKFSLNVGLVRCIDCGHRWIDYEGAREKCYLCESSNLSECVSLTEIREKIATMRKEDKKYLDKYAKRTVILKQLYREIAELSLRRAQEIYGKVKEHYTSGNLSDKVLDQLILAFRLFSELGVHKSAAAIAYMTASGYAQRGVEKEIREVEDLSDLVAARQWFMRLNEKDWEAAVNLRIGERAMSAVSTDHHFLQSMMQVSLWHYYKARDHYFQEHRTNMVDRIQFDIERTTNLLSSYTRGASQIEAAKITAQSTVRHGEEIRKGLETLGQSVHYGLTALGQHIENCGGSLTRALASSATSLSANVNNAMYTLASSSKYRGRSLDRRMSNVGKLISTTAKEIPDGFFQPLKELGAKFALGAVGQAMSNEITSEPSVIKLTETVLPEAKKSEESFKRLDEPTLKLTGTLLDTLVTKGMSKVVEQLEEQEASQKRS